ncbi:MAG: efflux RND transporter periplasmic adaptor subunit [Acidobacteria bacterium]|nr:efflux RND transporter periplasmic adaptor subunit [Acidobacteriota bacterium]
MVPYRLLAICAIATALLSGCKAQQTRSAGPPPPVPVSVAVATKESAPVQIRAVGTVDASASVQIKSRIDGQLMNVRFAEGSNVSQGDLLFEIDPREFRQALRQAEAAVAKDTALLKQAEANRARDIAQSKNADAIAERNDALAKAGVISREQNDQFRTNAEAMRETVQAGAAAIESARALLEADRAAVDRARLDLSYCEIRSPVSGRAGNLLVHAGNMIKANTDTLVVINQLAPIFVSFGVPQDYLPAIRQTSAARKLPVLVSSQNDSGKAIEGSLDVIDNTVDPNTGTIRLKAVFSNKERLLWPGQFVNVVLTLDTRADATLVPSESVQAGQKGQFIYVVKPDQSTEMRPVTVGPTVGRKVIIEKGITPGETVVTDGQLRLFPGAQIRPVPASLVESQPL